MSYQNLFAKNLESQRGGKRKNQGTRLKQMKLWGFNMRFSDIKGVSQGSMNHWKTSPLIGASKLGNYGRHIE